MDTKTYSKIADFIIKNIDDFVYDAVLDYLARNRWNRVKIDPDKVRGSCEELSDSYEYDRIVRNIEEYIDDHVFRNLSTMGIIFDRLVKEFGDEFSKDELETIYNTVLEHYVIDAESYVEEFIDEYCPEDE